jgi:hypothetical protein
MTRPFRKIAGVLALTIVALATETAVAADAPPQTTPEGMELIKQTRSRLVYAMPGATLQQYTRVALFDCQVAFAKNWERDYNRKVSPPGRRIRAEDMEKIKSRLAEEFSKVFTEELTDAGYEIVDHAGDDVLVVRPAIINLEVTAPDLGPTGWNHVVVRSAGRMTLHMELFDSTTGAIIARVMDLQESNRGIPMDANRATNRAEADKILRGWARELAEQLGAAREDTSAGVEN